MATRGSFPVVAAVVAGLAAAAGVAGVVGATTFAGTAASVVAGAGVGALPAFGVIGLVAKAVGLGVAEEFEAVLEPERAIVEASVTTFGATTTFLGGAAGPVGQSNQLSANSPTTAISAAKKRSIFRRTVRSIIPLSSCVSRRNQASRGNGVGSGSGVSSRRNALSISLSDHIASFFRSSALGQHCP